MTQCYLLGEHTDELLHSVILSYLDNDVSRLWRLTNGISSHGLTPACTPNVTDAAGTCTGTRHENGRRVTLAST